MLKKRKTKYLPWNSWRLLQEGLWLLLWSSSCSWWWGWGVWSMKLEWKNAIWFVRTHVTSLSLSHHFFQKWENHKNKLIDVWKRGLRTNHWSHVVFSFHKKKILNNNNNNNDNLVSWKEMHWLVSRKYSLYTLSRKGLFSENCGNWGIRFLYTIVYSNLLLLQLINK